MYFNNKFDFEDYISKVGELELTELILENIVTSKLNFYGISTRSIFKNCTFEMCDFQGLDLSTSVIIDCKFIGCNLYKTNFFNAIIDKILIQECDLTRSNFNQVILRNCTINECILTSTEFVDATLVDVKFLKNKNISIYKLNWIVKNVLLNSRILLDNVQDSWLKE